MIYVGIVYNTIDTKHSKLVNCRNVNRIIVYIYTTKHETVVLMSDNTGKPQEDNELGTWDSNTFAITVVFDVIVVSTKQRNI